MSPEARNQFTPINLTGFEFNPVLVGKKKPQRSYTLVNQRGDGWNMDPDLIEDVFPIGK